MRNPKQPKITKRPKRRPSTPEQKRRSQIYYQNRKKRMTTRDRAFDTKRAAHLRQLNKTPGVVKIGAKPSVTANQRHVYVYGSEDFTKCEGYSKNNKELVHRLKVSKSFSPCK